MNKIRLLIVTLLLIITSGCTKQNQPAIQELSNKNEQEYALSAYELGLKIQNNTSICLQWANEISKHWNEATQYNKDINLMVETVQKTAEDGGLFNNLRTERKDIDTLMNELNNPPEKYKDLYSKLLSYYGQYTTAYDLALNPTGSLLSFNNSISNVLSETNRQFNEFKTLIPQDIVNN